MSQYETKILESKYTVINRNLGKGGMGTVWLCQDKTDGKKVAIKILKNDYNEVEKSRFKNEIRTLSTINSPYVVKYYDANFSDSEQWISMEFVQGESLKQIIAKHDYLDLDSAVGIAKMIAEALIDIHSLNIIHRDLKSSNIIIRNDNIVKIIDFGISIDSDSQRLTKTGNVIGTPEYMAPELIEMSDGPSVQSDMYSFGILLYEMLEGSVPFHSKEPKVQLRNHLYTPIPNLTRLNTMIPQSVQNIINKCCAKKAIDRYENMTAVWKALNDCLKQENLYEKPQNPDKKERKAVSDIFSNKKFTIGLLAIGFVLLIIVIIILILSSMNML